MKKLLVLSGYILILNSCSSNYHTYPMKKPEISSNNVINNTEREYHELLKTYKPETAEVLTDLLNGPSGNPKTSITVENNSRCNMVLTISGKNYLKKIPIGAGKIGTAMVLKDQNYNLYGKVCESVYQKTKFITTSYNITLSN